MLKKRLHKVQIQIGLKKGNDATKQMIVSERLTSSKRSSSMSREAKSFLCLSMTTLRGGLPGIGLKGSITYAQKVLTVKLAARAYLGVDISHTLSLSTVEAHIDLWVAEVLLADD